MIGNAIDYGSTTVRNLKTPPLIPGTTNEYYDSVKGNT